MQTASVISDTVFVDGQHQQRRLLVHSELFNSPTFGSRQANYFRGPGVANVEPDNLWRKTLDKTSLPEISIFRNDREPVLPGKNPNLTIIGALQSNISYMSAFRILILQSNRKCWTQILVEEELHAAELVSRRSRDAAKAKHALISSRVRSGKSDSILSSSIPPAMYSNTSYTVMRVPLMQGFPLRIEGFTEIRSCQFMIEKLSRSGWNIKRGKSFCNDIFFNRNLKEIHHGYIQSIPELLG